MHGPFLYLLAMLAPDPAQHFDKRIAPILVKRCLGCHNQDLKDGGIAFDDRSSLLKGGNHGPTIVPGKPEGSFLIQALRYNGDVRMPPGKKLPPKEVKALTEWIRNGAVWGTSLNAR